MEEIFLALCIIKVLCLLSIAMSIYKLADSSEYMSDVSQGANNSGAELRFGAIRSGFMGDGQGERPVFSNLGSVEEVEAALQAASKVQEETAAALDASVRGYNPNLKSGFRSGLQGAKDKYPGASGFMGGIERFAGMGL